MRRNLIVLFVFALFASLSTFAASANGSYCIQAVATLENPANAAIDVTLSLGGSGVNPLESHTFHIQPGQTANISVHHWYRTSSVDQHYSAPDFVYTDYLAQIVADDSLCHSRADWSQS